MRRLPVSVVVAVMAFGGIAACSGTPDTPLTDGVYDFCKQSVEPRLAHPGSSSFEGIDQASIVLNDKDGTEVSYVDAANAFGATTRVPFTCQVHYLGKGDWRLTNIDISQAP